MLSQTSVRFLTHFGRAYPHRTALMVGLMLLSGLAEGFGIITMLPLLETVMQQEGEVSRVSQTVAAVLGAVGLSPGIVTLLAFVVLGILLKAALLLLAMKQVGYTVAKVAADLRLRLIAALLNARWCYFTSRPAGQFANAISVEANRSSTAYRAACSSLAAIVQAVVYAALAFLVSWRIALFGVVGGLMVVIIRSGLIQASRAAGQAQSRLSRSLLSQLTDALQGIKPIKAMARTDHFRGLLERETREINRAQQRQVLASELLKATQEPLLVVLLAVALGFAFTVGTLAFPLLVMVTLLFYRLMGRITLAQSEYQAMANGESAFWQMMETITQAEEQEELLAAGPDISFRHAIRLEDVWFDYGDEQVLRGVDITINKGEMVTLIGPSGAGKTTIVDLIVGLHRPTSGRILVDDVPLSEVDLVKWRARLGYVPQESLLLHDTVRNNVTLGDDHVSEAAVTNALRAAGAEEFVAALPEGLDTVLGDRGSRLSGGQRQRIAIARALVRNPQLLVLDEVTTALDPVTEQEVCATLDSLKASVTILSISHQAALARIADRVYELEGGKVRNCSLGAPAPAGVFLGS